MQKAINFIETYAAGILRLGMAAVILWFSLQQFLHNGQWTAYVPDSIVALTHMSAGVIVFLNAVFELVFGVLLAFGWQTRIVALLLSLHLFDIMYTVGYGEIGVRDLGLAVATFVVFMNGSDLLCFQQKKKGMREVANVVPRMSPSFASPTPRMSVPKIPVPIAQPSLKSPAFSPSSPPLYPMTNKNMTDKMPSKTFGRPTNQTNQPINPTNQPMNRPRVATDSVRPPRRFV